MKFTKMHGIGNAYIFVDCFSQQVENAPALAREMSNWRTGVGSDGLILVYPSKEADARMEMYNLDGSRAEMCGNGIRCFAKFIYEHDIARKNPLRVETDAGLRELDLILEGDKVTDVRVDMGEPIFEPERLPTTLAREDMTNRPYQILGYSAGMTCLSMGNPHAVIFGVPLELLTEEVLRAEGRCIENDPVFPNRVNAHFVRVDAPDEISMIHWERGSGATLACGTGAAATCVAGVLNGLTQRKILAHLPGGDLQLEWSEADNHVYLTGPAVEIFNGDWPMLQTAVVA